MASEKTKTSRSGVDRYNAGVSFYNKGEFTKAIIEFRAALESSKRDHRYAHALASAYNNRATSKYAQKKYSEAVGDFKHAVELDSKNKQYADNLRLAQESARKDNIDKMCKSAYEAFNKKNYTESVRLLKEARQLSPQDKELIEALAVAYNGRGVHEYSQGRYVKAIEDFEMAHKLVPTNKQYLENVSRTKEAEKRASRRKK